MKKDFLRLEKDARIGLFVGFLVIIVALYVLIIRDGKVEDYTGLLLIFLLFLALTYFLMMIEKNFDSKFKFLDKLEFGFRTRNMNKEEKKRFYEDLDDRQKVQEEKIIEEALEKIDESGVTAREYHEYQKKNMTKEEFDDYYKKWRQKILKS